MRITIPKEWETINLQTEQNPNKFGEALRNYCFIGNCNAVGCYSTFKVLDCFKEVKLGKIYNEAKKILKPEFKDYMHVYHYKLEEKDCYIPLSDFKGNIIREKIYVKELRHMTLKECKEFERGFDLFKEHFFSLWD